MKMVDVGEKEETLRVARAEARVYVSAAALRAMRQRRVPKGDVVAAARLAGIMAAKRTPDWIPLCHPIRLSGVSVEISVLPRSVSVVSEVRTTDRTGVEMEALSAVSAAALTVYDMLKSIDRGIRFEVALLEKAGGRSGTWRRKSARAPAVSRGGAE